MSRRHHYQKKTVDPVSSHYLSRDGDCLEIIFIEVHLMEEKDSRRYLLICPHRHLSFSQIINHGPLCEVELLLLENFDAGEELEAVHDPPEKSLAFCGIARRDGITTKDGSAHKPGHRGEIPWKTEKTVAILAGRRGGGAR